ncbi:hypothetical protein GCM10028818_59520 [Spirosoma horti]
MKSTRILSQISRLLLVFAFSACTDHRLPEVIPGSGTRRLRVKTITQDLPNNTAKVSAFKYDAQGRLGSIITYETPDSTVAPVENNVYTYDAQNRLTQLRQDIVSRSVYSPNPVTTYNFSYNTAGQVVSLVESVSGGGVWGVNPQYNTGNQVVGSTKSYDLPGVQIRESSAFTHTGNNITFVSTTYTTIRNITSPPVTVNTTLTYDTNVNPFYGVFVIPAPYGLSTIAPSPGSGTIINYSYYGGISNLLNLSQNNVLSAVNGSGQTTTYTYTYNSANLPTSRITTDRGFLAETLHYEYETY